MTQAVQEVLGLKDLNREGKEPSVFYNHSIEHASFDLELYDELREMSPILDQTLNEGESKLKTFPDLSQDMFLSLFKYNPKLREDNVMAPSRKFNHGLMEEVMQTEEFQKLRDMCRLNLLNSAIGTEVMHNKALVKINTIIEERKRQMEQAKKNGGDIPPDLLDQINKLVQQEQQAQNGQPNDKNGQQPGDPNAPQMPGGGVIGDIGQGGNPNNGQNQNGDSVLTKEAAQKLAEIQSQQASDPAMMDLERQIKEELQKAAKEAQTDVKEMDEFLDAWGFGDDDAPSRVSFEDTRGALERIRKSKELKKLTEIIGKFRNIAKNNLKKKSKGEGVSIKDVTVGDDIAKALPSERAMLCDPKTKKLFYKKFSEKQLLQYEVEANKRKGMGPMVVYMDKSGSMGDDKMRWAKAVSLALLEIAQRQKRNFSFASFTTKVQDKVIIPKGELKPNVVLNIAEIGSTGSTNFNKPLQDAMKVIGSEKNFRKADIVFITDGDCSVDRQFEEEFVKMKKEKNICVQTIIIDMGGHCSARGVENWSDKITRVSSLADLGDTTAEDIFNVAIDG